LHQYMTGSDMKKFGFLSVSLVTIMLVASTAHAEIASKAYVDDLIDPVATQITTHAADTNVHVTAVEKAAWDAKQDALGYTPENHANMVTSTSTYNTYLTNADAYPNMPVVNQMIANSNITTNAAIARKIDSQVAADANTVMVRDSGGNYVKGLGNAVSVANDGTITVNEATKATQDGSGNTITTTYQTKSESNVTTAGDYISTGTNVAANLGALDTAVAANADAIDDIDDKIGTVTAGKTVVEMISDAQTAATYDDTALAARVGANEDAIDVLNGDATTTGSVAKQIADAVTGLETSSHASSTYQTKSDSTAVAGNYISAGTGVGANLGALDTAAKNAKDAADAAALTANAAIPKPDDACEDAANKCVLTYNNSTYYWEVIGR